MKLKKSELAPTQDLVYIGANFCTDLGRLYLPETWIQALTISTFVYGLGYRLAARFQLLLLALVLQRPLPLAECKEWSCQFPDWLLPIKGSEMLAFHFLPLGWGEAWG